MVSIDRHECRQTYCTMLRSLYSTHPSTPYTAQPQGDSILFNIRVPLTPCFIKDTFKPILSNTLSLSIMRGLLLATVNTATCFCQRCFI